MMCITKTVNAWQRLIHQALAAALIAAFAVTMPVHAQLPTLGDGSEMSAGAERKLGERIARELYRDPDYIDDPVLVEYVQGIWQPLLAAARQRGELSVELDQRFAWEIFLGKDRSINAFALPGGYLGLHLGLVGAVANRDELASVLAHELSHVTQRHISRLMTQQNRQTPWVIGAMILGAIAASKNPDAANAVMAGGQALAMQNQLNFSRDMEREADRIGYGVMTQAGFEPLGFVTMFDKLQQASRLNDNGSFPYLRSHPMTTERMADMQARQQLAGRNVPPAPPSLEHVLVTARARVLSQGSVDALRARVAEAQPAVLLPQSPARQAAALYAAALASLKQRDAGQAERFALALRPLVQGEAAAARLARLLLAEIALTSADAARAATLVSASDPGRPDVLLAAHAAVRSSRAGDAAQRLQTWVTLHPRDATAWQLLAQAYGAQGQGVRAIRAEAEAQVAWLDYAAAMDRFKAAQELVRRMSREGTLGSDHIEASIIDTRARQVESLLREQALER
jgi:predicted Zn-dependent protease